MHSALQKFAYNNYALTLRLFSLISLTFAEAHLIAQNAQFCTQTFAKNRRSIRGPFHCSVV